MAWVVVSPGASPWLPNDPLAAVLTPAIASAAIGASAISSAPFTLLSDAPDVWIETAPAATVWA